MVDSGRWNATNPSRSAWVSFLSITKRIKRSFLKFLVSSSESEQIIASTKLAEAEGS